MPTVTMIRSAVISECGLYRYTLSRSWSPKTLFETSTKTVNFVMLNPSKADGSVDDATLRRCVGFSKRWGIGGLVITNLFAFRSPDPKALRTAPDPVGPGNDDFIRLAAKSSDMVVCAWGNHGAFMGRDASVLKLFALNDVRPLCLGRTASGAPLHPLRLSAALDPVPMSVSF